MKYHDYHLRGYSVSDFGKTITLDLVLDYPNHPKDESRIEFSDVAAYNFFHVGRAIITDITETPLSKISSQVETDLIESAFDGDFEMCKTKMGKEGYKLWTIWSAIGFAGSVIAKSVK